MATAQDVVNRAARLIEATASGEAPTTIEASDALIALNDLLDSWSADKLLVYALTDTAFTLTPSTASYTVGPAGNFALTPRPQRLTDAFVRITGSQDLPVQLVEEDRWVAITQKNSASDRPIFGYYEPSMPTGTLLLWPVPTKAYDLHIVTWVPCSELSTLATTLAFPPGWRRALAYNLAVDIASEYGVSVRPGVAQIANESKATIMRANHRTMIMYTELGLMLANRRQNILTGMTP